MGALEEVRDLAEAVARRHSVTLWDVEVGGRPGRMIVRIFVDKEGGVDLDEVALVSEEISRGLDLRDPIPGRYTLEVSSPGLERSLRSAQHFEMSMGRRAVVKTTEMLHGDSHRVEGVIEAVTEGRVVLATEDGRVEIPMGGIKSARTVFEWKGREAT